MSPRTALLCATAFLLACFSLQAQTFETRSTRHSGDTLLQQLQTPAHARQWAIRDSVLAQHTANLGPTDTVETFFNGHHMGLVVYRNLKPLELLGFWDPAGQQVDGGQLSGGTGTVKTPFNPKEVPNFKSESVQYVAGLKNGASFYYCDCASVLRRGTFMNNLKVGLWKEFSPSGEFIKEKELEIPVPPQDILNDGIKRDWIGPAHCMMKADWKDCPNLDTKGGKK